MNDEEYTLEQMEAQRREVSRLRSELKAFSKARALMSREDKERTRLEARELQDRYDHALGILYGMRHYFRWERGLDREYGAALFD